MNREVQLYEESIDLLKQLIATPSFSKEEDKTAIILQRYLEAKGVVVNREMNNVWAVNQYFDYSKPNLLLNSHHDTVKPNPGFTRPAFEPYEADGTLFGLGSNDAGGCLVSLIAAFLFYHDQPNLKYNIVLAATAEEEISGANGIERLLPLLPKPVCAIVGEPTGTNLAIAEKGLLVLDVTVGGKAGHAAREEGESALYKAMEAINWIRTYQFPKISETLGPVKMTVTSINTPNKAHNVVPDQCSFIVDVRVTDAYTHEEILAVIREHINGDVQPRSMRLRSSSIPVAHPLVRAGMELGKTTYGSPTSSDMAFIPVPALKTGPGESARSHTADEFIYLEEIENGIQYYIALLKALV